MTKTTTTRQDPHSPRNLDPRAYSFVGVIYYGTDVDLINCADNDRCTAALKRSAWSGHTDCQCDHCGSRYMYGCVFQHKPTGEHIAVGHVCADDAFDGLTSAIDFQMKRVKKQVAAARKTDRARKAAAEFVAKHEGLKEAFEVDHHIINDIESRLRQWGSISDKQVELVFKIGRQMVDREAEKAKEVANAGPMPEGRIEIEGEVIHTKWQDNPFAYGASTLKMLVRLADGNKVWGTMPTSLTDCDTDKGDTVKFTATVEVSDDDKHFGFFKRPAKAERVALRA